MTKKHAKYPASKAFIRMLAWFRFVAVVSSMIARRGVRLLYYVSKENLGSWGRVTLNTGIFIFGPIDICLLVLLLSVPTNNFSLMSQQFPVFLG